VVLVAFYAGLIGLAAGGSQKEMTIFVESGTSECFYEPARRGSVIDLEYQVIDGGYGDPDISFVLYDTEGELISSDYKKSDNIHRLEVKVDGDHRFCFDNSFSMFNRKTVFFEIVIETEDDDDTDEWGPEVLDGVTQEEFVDMKIQDIQESISRVHHHLNRVKVAQDIHRSFEARDRNMAEDNNFRVGTWSVFQICMMLSVGALQVFMLRSLFETDPKSVNIWKKIPFIN